MVASIDNCKVLYGSRAKRLRGRVLRCSGAGGFSARAADIVSPMDKILRIEWATGPSGQAANGPMGPEFQLGKGAKGQGTLGYWKWKGGSVKPLRC
mmetsp:Transcript_20663/g.32338  ORF Transcript_20663/g.32338 Transcript_20663/m.32338 type:complete len:96 (-) Transcript_20663:25-312(-)